MPNGRVLLADLDGQAMTIALAAPGEPPRELDVVTCRTPEELRAAIDARLDQQGGDRLVGAAFSAAGPVINGAITITSADFHLSLGWLREVTRTPKVHLLNDLAALAMGVPKTPSSQLTVLSPGDVDGGGALAVIGVGLGLGVAGLAPAPGDSWRAVPSEAGHIDCFPREAREFPVFEAIRERRGDTTAERLLSRAGLCDIYGAVGGRVGDGGQSAERADIVVESARTGDPAAREAISIFSGVLGAFARDVALAFAARGGVFISSPLITRFGDLFDREAFGRRYAQAGPMSGFVRAIRVSGVAGRPVLAGLSGLFSTNDRVFQPSEVAYLDC